MANSVLDYAQQTFDGILDAATQAANVYGSFQSTQIANEINQQNAAALNAARLNEVSLNAAAAAESTSINRMITFGALAAAVVVASVVVYRLVK